MNVKDLVKDVLEAGNQKLDLLDEYRMGLALEDFVAKGQRLAIDETVEKRSKITTSPAVQEVCMADANEERSNEETSKVARNNDEDKRGNGHL